ncbi:unnamed protein product [Vicia faba]|uniref:Uncharacterized protein n=1 Tax=Vicia faba TaxID=3906 RepID=A0AAV1B7M2_VICFA|nr:unnamed protein product [Vicia faba]
MKDYSCDSQGRRCTQLWCSQPILKDVIKGDKEVVIQDVRNIMSNIMVTKVSSQREDEQVAEANALVIVFRLDGKRFPTNNKERMMNGICLYYRSIGIQNKMSIKVLTFEEVVQLLKEVRVTD